MNIIQLKFENENNNNNNNVSRGVLLIERFFGAIT